MKHYKKQYKFAVRRLKRCQNIVKNHNFLSNLLNKNADIFTEIKKMRGKVSSCSTRIDGAVGSENIANRFAEIYSKLYSTVKLGNDLLTLQKKICVKIEDEGFDVNRIDGRLIAKAIKQMKPNKKDSVFDTMSDMYINAPNELCQHISVIIKSMLSHGIVPSFLLLCTLTPIVKCSLDDMTSSSNYRAIAGGCLLLKIIDQVILIFEGQNLKQEELQFAYQRGSGTNLYTWLATTVIIY